MRILLWSVVGVAAFFLLTTLYPLPNKPVAGFIGDPVTELDHAEGWE